MKFKAWLIDEAAFKDIFGFEKDMFQDVEPQKTKPVRAFNIERIMTELARHTIGCKLPESKFSNIVQWGRFPGALRVIIESKLDVVIDRLALDLTGKPSWITKRVYQLNQGGDGGSEDAIAEEVLNFVLEVNEQTPDSPKARWDGLEKLVSSMAGTLRRVSAEIFIFEGVRQVNEDHYIIRMAVRGQGVQAPGQARVEENHTSVSYSKETGLIRICNFNVESPLGEHKWQLTPVDANWFYAPTQQTGEISQTIANNLRWY